MRRAGVVTGRGRHAAPRHIARPLAAAVALCVAGTVAVVRYEPARAAGFVLRVDAGDAGFPSLTRDRWVSDRHYVGGRSEHLTRGMGSALPEARVFRTMRVGMSAYRLPVPRAGTYRVRLLFAEPSARASGARVFDVTVEGAVLLDDFDLFAWAGRARAYSVAFVAGVTDGFLDLDFAGVVGEPVISGIEVVQDAGMPTTSTTTSMTPTTAPPSSATTVAEATVTTTMPPPATSTTTDVTFTTTTTPAPSATSAFPGPGNTGVPPGTVLQPSGGITTTRDGQVIEAMDVNGSIQVQHDNVVIRRTRVRNPGGEAIRQEPGRRGLVIEDCELDGTGNTNGAAAVAFAGFTMRRCDVHHFGEGVSANGDTLIEDNYFHDFTDLIASGAHQDGIQMEWGSNQVVRHNTIFMNVVGGNSAIWVSAQPHSNIRIEQNLVAGANFPIGGPNNNPDVHVLDNRISTRYYPAGGYFGPFFQLSGCDVRGNVWHESGQPV